MFITGLGNVRGINPETKIFIGNALVKVKDLDDQSLSLWVPALFKNEPLTASVNGSDNKKLRERLIKLNPRLTKRINK
ncbi:hypothetical protein A2926_00505 [Candidatus Giovannonibacteria bacterium RIFCSPLOWO2_01_FULL_44_40]|uniref:Uncharacterized protein n=1 Tax=Candidatus Giovannonibacteria bacterium RIFCSPHIGHO2_01_FULL_45_23 TaxID=1798325 RepID=A0A1F5VER8_9BACT|nr:MAG: hypothetical protein A2834_00520 [Candidatus Giovannonibacteria bacterium RIFCSPHIGHO2_01_FULL_45_23]OGF76526.1 MAG: hypothetical protein A3C77_03230 [Candidatus Giovannonibacteria bacterium RIFCSPHIGHO2_02_FULL_45_13]OGF79792.1 MAG: hypothetical protein A2926_00505 [Candidatus Giovannonibacteria bacterium RIFCSPLOWO2_01_FULL_44_40]